ncbi:DNA-directed RNA polymerases IV and V subunit 2-like protein, partial [Tanacetum coccineum]
RTTHPIEQYLDHAIITNGLTRAFSTGSWSHSYKSWEKTSSIVAFIRRAAPLQMVSDMRRTRQQVLYAGKAGDARYPATYYSCSHDRRILFLRLLAYLSLMYNNVDTVVNKECSKYVTLDKKLIQSCPFYFSDDNHSVDKVTIPSKVTWKRQDRALLRSQQMDHYVSKFKADSGIPSKVHNMEEAGPSLTENPTNGSLRLELALENSDHDTMIAAPSVRDLDQLAEVSRMRQV